MSAENPADAVIEQAARAITACIGPDRKWADCTPLLFARALSDAGLLATPADRDEHGYKGTDADGSLVGKLLARAERVETERDQLRAQVAAVRALADEWRYRPHPEGAESVSDWTYRMHEQSLGSLLGLALDTAGGERHE